MLGFDLVVAASQSSIAAFALGRTKVVVDDRLAPTAAFVKDTTIDFREGALLRRLRKAGGEVRRPYQVTAIVNESDGVTVEYTDVDGATGSIRADYVIGTDGMHSVVREQAGIGFTGDSYAASFVLADVRMDWPIARDEVALHLSPEGITVVAPSESQTPVPAKATCIACRAKSHAG